MEIILASSNENKVKEIRKMAPSFLSFLSLKDIAFTKEIEETATTLEGNSKIKAKTIYDLYKKPVLAEDTGLEVFALNGEPGVRTARYAGEPSNSEKNMDLLLKNLANCDNRKAQFRTVATFVYQDTYYQYEGIVLGEIVKKRTGKDGFGYDPIFRPAGFETTFAEMTIEEKNWISHRAIAIKKCLQFIKQFEKTS